MERTLISWSLPNFVTIVLMAFFGWLLVGLACQGIKRVKGNSSGQEANA